MTQSGEDQTSQGNYRVLARKYRPQNFDDLIGQEPMVQTLSNAFETGRIAQAYMLTGVRGIGKTTTARILARALNYKSDSVDKPSVDLSVLGENCQAIMDGNHLDIIEMDAASHTGIDDIRDLIESAQYKPTSARYKVYIIDEVHMLSRNAFNGLLKTLEEPPEHLKFIFATTEIRKVPVTVLSRCQRFDLRRITSQDMAPYLSSIAEKENVTIDDNAMAMIVRASEGSMRDALSLLDQAIAHSAGASDTINIVGEGVRAMLGLADRARVIDLFEQLMKGDIAACLKELRAQYDVGAEPSVVLSDLADFIHFVTRLKYVPQAGDDPAISESESKKGGEFAKSLSVRVLGRAWQILLKGIEEVNASERPLMAADMVLVRLAHAASLPTPDEVIRSLDGATTSGASPSAQNSPPPSPNGGAPAPTQTVTTQPSSPTQMPPRMTGTDGPQLSVVANTPAPELAPVETPQLVLERFEQLIFLAEDKRDLQVKTFLRRNVRLVSFEDGKMEFSLAGNPQRHVISEIQHKLLKWTGKRWNLVISRKEGAPSLDEVEQAEEQSKFDAARNDPAVEAILAKFPGAKVIDVRIRSDEEEEIIDDGDPDGLDDII